MGTWGTGTFDNDQAMDWCLDFLDAPDGLGEDEDEPGKDSLIIGALSFVLESVDTEEYLEAPICDEALAAAEIVAAINGKPCPELTPEAEPEEGEDDEVDDLAQIAQWAERGETTIRGQASIREMARKAVAAVRADSELKELWGEDADWDAVTADLERRLA